MIVVRSFSSAARQLFSQSLARLPHIVTHHHTSFWNSLRIHYIQTGTSQIIYPPVVKRAGLWELPLIPGVNLHRYKYGKKAEHSTDRVYKKQGLFVPFGHRICSAKVGLGIAQSDSLADFFFDGNGTNSQIYVLYVM